MATTPNGDPAWLRNASHETYGGHAAKANYRSQGVVNPRTDVGAAQFVRMAADLAAVVRVQPFCTLVFLADDTNGDPPDVEYCALQTGVRTVAYVGNNPPAGFPAVTRTSDGVHVVTFDANYLDEYGVSGAFVPRGVMVTGEGATPFDVGYTISGQAVTVYATSGGSPEIDRRVTVEVW